MRDGLGNGFVDLSFGQTAFLGILQGITELVPVFFQRAYARRSGLSRWPDPGAAFSAAMQMAALVG